MLKQVMKKEHGVSIHLDRFIHYLRLVRAKAPFQSHEVTDQQGQ